MLAQYPPRSHATYSAGTSTFPGASLASASLSTVVSTRCAAPRSERLARVGAFRVVPAEELRRPDERLGVLRKDLENLGALGLVRTMPYVVGRERTTIVTLTERGRDVVAASYRPRDAARPQAFYAGIAKERELAHDVRVHQAYRDAAERLIGGGRTRSPRRARAGAQARVSGVPAGTQPRPTRQRRDGRSAMRSRLPDGRSSTSCRSSTATCSSRTCASSTRRPTAVSTSRDVEVMTPHYRGAHAAAKVAAGFARYGAVGARLSGGRGSSRGGRCKESRLAEEMLR